MTRAQLVSMVDGMSDQAATAILGDYGISLRDPLRGFARDVLLALHDARIVREDEIVAAYHDPA